MTQLTPRAVTKCKQAAILTERKHGVHFFFLRLFETEGDDLDLCGWGHLGWYIHMHVTHYRTPTTDLLLIIDYLTAEQAAADQTGLFNICMQQDVLRLCEHVGRGLSTFIPLWELPCVRLHSWCEQLFEISKIWCGTGQLDLRRGEHKQPKQGHSVIDWC